MWAGGNDGRYRETLTRPHLSYARIEVTDYQGTTVLADLPFLAGQVQATLQSRVARKLQFTVTRDWYPVDPVTEDVDPSAPLAPFGNRVRVFWGVRYGDGSTAEFPVFYGRLETCDLSPDGSVAVAASDLAADIVDGGFLYPTNSIASNTIHDEWRRLILEAVPDASFGVSDSAAPLIGVLAWDTDRGQALDDMINSMGQIWYPLADGTFVHRDSPWTNPSLTTVATLTDASGAWPMLAGYGIRISRLGVVNAVVVTAERLDGTAPQNAVVFNQDSASPTLYGGPFGKHPQVVQNQAALTQPQCLVQAKTQLHLGQSLTQVWQNVSIIPDGALELGDLLTLKADGVTSQQVLTGFTLPLRENDSMSLILRAYTPLEVV